MTDHNAMVQRLRWAESDTADPRRTIFGDAATAIETLIAQQKVLVAEVEAARVYERFNPNPADNNDEYHRRRIEAFQRVTNARRAVNAAFPGGLTK